MRARKNNEARQPLVSIIIPSYNYARYLPGAIKSALNQSYPNIEVIVADDGSTDASARVAASFPVKAMRMDHRGIADAVNNAAKAAKGSYISILGADDLLHPDFVKLCMAKISDTGADFAYTQTVGFGADSFLFKSMQYDPKYLLKSWYIPATFLMEKSAYAAAGGYDASLEANEDYDFLLSLSERGFSGALVPAPLFFYRQHRRGSRGMSPALKQFRAFRKIRAKHRLLYNRCCGFADKAQLLAMDIGTLLFCTLRDIFSGFSWWPFARNLARAAVSALLGKKIYSGGVPAESLKMIKKLDSGAF